MIKAYYKNSKGEVLWLTRAPFRTIDADWFDSTWEETEDGYEKVITLDVFGKREEFIQNMETLYRIISVDAETGNYGRLYVNDTFLPCQIYKTKKTGWKGYVYTEVELTFLASELSWITVLEKRFFPQKEIAADSGLDFPCGFPFDFMNEKRGTVEFEVKVVSGTKVVDIAMNIGYAALFSIEQLQELFGTDYTATRLSIKTYNGDDVAQEVHFYAPEVWNGVIFQYFYPTNREGKMRVNYRLEYVYG